MLTDIKSLYGKICVVLVSAIWALYLAQSTVGIVLIFIPSAWRGALSALLALLLVVAIGRFLWPRVAHFGFESVVNSTKVTIAIFLLTLALIAFPGTLLIPLVYAALSSTPDALLYAWFSVFGLPVFIVLSIVGLVLVYQSRVRQIRDDAS